MRFAILKAGTAYRGARERLGDFHGMFTNLLARPGQDWHVFDVEHGNFPEEVRAFDGYTITGSAAAAYDAAPWVTQLLHLIRTIHEHRIPLLGVCFGHQAVAKALGGQVAPHPRGWDLGVRSLAPTPAGATSPWLRNSPRPLTVFELHGDAVISPPRGALRLAGSEHTEWEMFSVGAKTMCMQGHPEFDVEAMREAATRLGGKGVVPAEVVDRALASLSVPIPRTFWSKRLGGFLARDGESTSGVPA